MNENQQYLQETVPKLLQQLTDKHEPNFGIMTPQHMVEHLIWVTKSSIKDFGPPPSELSEKQLGFMRFVHKGAHLKHRPSDKKRKDLDPPRLSDLTTAIAGIPEAIDRLYNQDPNREFYNPLMGKLTFEELELFHANHFRYHLEEQFGLVVQGE